MSIELSCATWCSMAIVPCRLRLSTGRAAPRLSSPNRRSAATSEMAVTLLLAVAKGLLPRDRAFRAVSAANAPMWTPGFMEPPTEAPTPTLSGKEALVLGYGACGTRVARALNALGMRVNACRRHAGARPTSDGVATVYSIDHLNHLLPSIAVLIVCLPGTKSTTGLLGAAQLAMLPKGAIVDRALPYAYERSPAGQLDADMRPLWYCGLCHQTLKECLRDHWKSCSRHVKMRKISPCLDSVPTERERGREYARAGACLLEMARADGFPGMG